MNELPLADVLAQYRADADLPARAIAGLTTVEMLAFPIPGTWSIQQIVMHLMDSDLIGSDRMKRVIAEDNPSLIAYDESAFAQRLYYDRLDPVLACELFRLNRQMTANLLHQLPSATFARVGTHSEKGCKTLEDLVRDYTQHARYHVDFIDQKKAILRGRG